MFRVKFRTAIVAAGVGALLAGSSVVGIPDADAAPQPDPQVRSWQALPPPVAPAVPGYRISGYNLGKGNYLGAIDPQSGKLWITNVSPMFNSQESSLLEIDPRTMKVLKRVQVTQRSPKKPQNINGQYAIDIPRGGSTVWTTGAVDDTMSIWDKNTGALVKRLPGVAHSRALTFVEELGIAVVATAKPAGLSFFDIATYKPLGKVRLPHAQSGDYAPGLDVSGASRRGADVTVSSYYTNLSQLRITRAGDRVTAVPRWSTPLPGPQGHGDVLAVPSQNAAYVTNLYLGTVSRYDLRSGKHLADILTGPGPTTLARDPRRRIIYVTNYFGGFISVIDERTGSVSKLMTTGLLPNKVLMNGSTAIVLDKSSAALAGGIVADRGIDRVWKLTPTR